jgi:DNA-binding MarR family transcriptional regulator
MTDINIAPVRDGSLAAPADTGAKPGEDLAWDLIELLFFAYRDFVGDADEVLTQYGFGRAHHRVLHFVHRNPGMTVAGLLAILKITKQSLGRVLRELVEKGFIEQREGAADRRQRLLLLTPAGEALILDLADRQTRRLERAIKDAGFADTAPARRFLIAMLDPKARVESERLIARADRARRALR